MDKENTKEFNADFTRVSLFDAASLHLGYLERVFQYSMAQTLLGFIFFYQLIEDVFTYVREDIYERTVVYKSLFFSLFLTLILTKPVFSYNPREDFYFKPSHYKASANILFFHGHGDNTHNHEHMFNYLSKHGLNIYAFDYPEHGLNKTNDLDAFGIKELARIGLDILEKSAPKEIPTFVMGWSLGGLIALSIATSSKLAENIEGFIFISPALYALPFPGGDGISRIQTLTQNRKYYASIKPYPNNFFVTPLFTFDILKVSNRIKSKSLKKKSLFILSDEKLDQYVDNKKNLVWAQKQSVSTKIFSCQHTYHALHLEPYPIPDYTQALILSFINNIENSFFKNKRIEICRDIIPKNKIENLIQFQENLKGSQLQMKNLKISLQNKRKGKNGIIYSGKITDGEIHLNNKVESLLEGNIELFSNSKGKTQMMYELKTHNYHFIGYKKLVKESSFFELWKDTTEISFTDLKMNKKYKVKISIIDIFRMVFSLEGANLKELFLFLSNFLNTLIKIYL